MNLLRAEEVAFLFSLGFLSCVTAQTDGPGAGILPFPGGIEPILSPRTQIPTARFGDQISFSCILTMLRCHPRRGHPSEGPAGPGTGGAARQEPGAVVVGSSVFTGGAARGCTTGGRVRENTVSLPPAVGAAELPAGMDGLGTQGHGDLGGWGRRVRPLAWHEDTAPGMQGSSGAAFCVEPPLKSSWGRPVGGMLGVVVE